ncbi:PIR protein [Plasmodium vivax]|uniref:VIR protein n=1 Tax=Plasmodium vivax TaxID=5855 RepID=A0A565A4R6_PLAVI|nr:PIR protein [Plasmodium vivax]
MLEIELDKSLLNYKEYFDLKEKFKYTNSEKDELNLDDFLDKEKFNSQKKNAFMKILKELLKYLRNYGVFYDGDHNPCSYISYILSKEVKDKNYTYDQKTFEMFKTFVHMYNNRDNYNSKNCSTTLVHVNFEIYNKMEKLYALYEEFKNFLKEYELWKDVPHCSAIHSFLNLYNDFIRNYQPTNTKYKNILDHFRNEIKTQVDFYNTVKCAGEHFHIELHTLPEDNKPKASSQVEQRQNHAGYQEFQAKILPPPVVSETRRAESETSRAESERPHAVSQTAHVHLQTPHEESHPPQEKLAPGSQDDVQQEAHGFPHKETHQREFPIDLSSVYPTRNRPLESLGTSSYSDQYPYTFVPLSANEVPGASSSVMSTITNALKDVDPVPVVGVSGGMGALFLLFRYTPVGAFFRGGRGRVHRIPRSFNGPFPGGFPGFEEYESGYIGYGPMNPLAE